LAGEEVVEMIPPAYMFPVYIGRPSCATGAVVLLCDGRNAPPEEVVEVLLRG